MTCIVGLECPDGRVIIGGDSAGVSGWDLDVRADTKVFTRGAMAYGFTTSFRMGQILRYAKGQALDGVMAFDADVDAWMATTFVDAVRKALKTGGYARKVNEEETGGTFLVGVAGRLYCVQGDYQVERTVSGFNAVGCGAAYALGAMWVQGAGMDAMPVGAASHIVTHALEAAERFSAGVRGPMHLVECGP